MDRDWTPVDPIERNMQDITGTRGVAAIEGGAGWRTVFVPKQSLPFVDRIVGRYNPAIGPSLIYEARKRAPLCPADSRHVDKLLAYAYDLTTAYAQLLERCEALEAGKEAAA